jgi:hypothetical protein
MNVIFSSDDKCHIALSLPRRKALNFSANELDFEVRKILNAYAAR